MIIAQTKMAAAPDGDRGDASRQAWRLGDSRLNIVQSELINIRSECEEVFGQDRKLQELFRGRFSLQEARELIAAKGGLEKAALFVLNGNPDEVTAFILHRRDALKHLREISATRVKQELTSGVSASIRLFACGDCNRYWWRKVPERKEVSQCHQCHVKYDPVPREHEWGLAVFECVCSNTFMSTGLMNETVRKCFKCKKDVYPARIIPPSVDLERKPRRAPMREFLRRDQTIFRQVYYPSRVHHSTGSTVSTCLTQGDLQENYNFPIVLPVIGEEDGSDDDNNDSN